MRLTSHHRSPEPPTASIEIEMGADEDDFVVLTFLNGVSLTVDPTGSITFYDTNHGSPILLRAPATLAEVLDITSDEWHGE